MRQSSTEPLFVVKNHKHFPRLQLWIFEDRLEYRRRALTLHEDRNVIHMTDVRSVSYTKGLTPWSNATLRVTTDSSSSGTFIEHTSNAEAEQAAKLIDEFMNRARSGTSAHDANQPTIPDQIRSLASLRDSGIITADEFEAKKSDLLSRI